MKEITFFLAAILSFAYGHAQCTFMLAPLTYTQITSNTNLNASGSIYWICDGLNVNINSSEGDNYVCENNVTLNIINSAGDNVYAKPGCIINNSSSQDISVICDPSTVTLNNTGSGSITIAQICLPVIYDYSLTGGIGTCALNSMDESELITMIRNQNPYSSQITYQTSRILKDAILIVYNSFGQVVKKNRNISGQMITVQLGNLTNGLYFFSLIQENNILYTDKIVITDN